MPENPGSQSAITLKLNLLAQHMRTNPSWPANVLERLRGPGTARAVLVALAQTSILGTTVASKTFEVGHIQNWPPYQQALIRQTLIDAISQRAVITFDWTAGPADSVAVRVLAGGGYGVTFYAPTPPTG
jgi:hypothetical protein